MQGVFAELNAASDTEKELFQALANTILHQSKVLRESSNALDHRNIKHRNARLNSQLLKRLPNYLKLTPNDRVFKPFLDLRVHQWPHITHKEC